MRSASLTWQREGHQRAPCRQRKGSLLKVASQQSSMDMSLRCTAPGDAEQRATQGTAALLLCGGREQLGGADGAGLPPCARPGRSQVLPDSGVSSSFSCADGKVCDADCKFCQIDTIDTCQAAAAGAVLQPSGRACCAAGALPPVSAPGEPGCCPSLTGVGCQGKAGRTQASALGRCRSLCTARIDCVSLTTADKHGLV